MRQDTPTTGPANTRDRNKDPRATWGQLIDWHDATHKRATYNKPPLDAQTKIRILTYIDTATTIEDQLAAYRIAELAGMVWWSIREGDWQWKH